MPIAELNGNRLYYEDTGGDGAAIVFSHGGFLDHTMWHHQVAALSGEYRCITWDERGHGMSECNGPFDYWDAAADVAGLMDVAGVERAVLVGMSQGGWLTQRFALATPERARGLVLTGTTMKPLTEQEKQGYGQMAQGWQTNGPIGEVAQAIAGVQFAGTDYDGSAYMTKWQGKPPSHWAEPWNTILNGDDVSGRFGEIACPVLFVHGTADHAFGVEAAEEMSAAVPDSRGVVVIEGGPHASPLTHPDEFNAALRGFMAAL